MLPLAVFAIVPADRVDRHALAVDGGGPTDLHAVTNGSFAAVVGHSVPGGLSGRSRDQLAPLLLSHQRVIEAVMATAPLLPVQFGTVVADEPAVGRLLQEGRLLFRQAFAELAHRVEMEVRVRWNLDEMLREIADTETIVARRTDMAARGEAGAEERLALGRLVAQEIEQRRSRLRQRILDVILPPAADAIVGPTPESDTVVDLSLLLDRAAGDMLDARLDALDREFAGRLHFRVVGPLPPYSFATVRAHCSAFDDVERACGMLGLDDTATATDLKAAYHRRLRDCHPDVAAPADGGNPMAAGLNEAYRLLRALFSPADDGGGGVSLRLDRASVEGRVLVSLVRREGAPWRRELAA